jgi:hypothetical protein
MMYNEYVISKSSYKLFYTLVFNVHWNQRANGRRIVWRKIITITITVEPLITDTAVEFKFCPL